MMTTRETRLRYYLRLRIRATILKIRHYPQYRGEFMHVLRELLGMRQVMQ